MSSGLLDGQFAVRWSGAAGEAAPCAHQPPLAHPASSRRIPDRTGSPARAAPSGHGPGQPRPAAAPAHVLQPGQASAGRPTSLIRGIRGQARSGNQNYGARDASPPQSGSRRHPPDQPEMTMQPLGTPARDGFAGTFCPLHEAVHGGTAGQAGARRPPRLAPLQMRPPRVRGLAAGSVVRPVVGLAWPARPSWSRGRPVTHSVSTSSPEGRSGARHAAARLAPQSG